MQVSKAMKYQKQPFRAALTKKKSSSKVSRPWAVKDAEKHLNKLSTPKVMRYLYKKHELGLAQLAVVVIFIVAILSNV